MVGYSFKTHNRCRLCCKYYKKEDCPIFTNKTGKQWAICPAGCSKFHLQVLCRNKTWRKYFEKRTPSKQPGKILKTICQNKEK